MQRAIESYTAEEKLEMYKLAIYLFDSGKSHPQIVEILGQENNSDLSLIITEKAFKEVWHKLYEHAALLLFKKKPWYKVVEKLKKDEPFPDVIELLVNDIYLRDTDMHYAEAEFQKKFEVWGYLLIMGVIQLVRYFISPYNKTFFWISMLVGAVGLFWGVWEFFFNNKNDKAFTRYFEQLTYNKFMSKLNRIELLFLEKKQRVLNVYCTAGYPQLDSTLEVIKALQENGADIIELGMPYSDPLADGPVIQLSGSIALANGMTIKILFEQLKDFRSPAEGGIGEAIPVVLMGYMNPVLQYGFEKFCADAAAVGIDGLILPDLPEHEFETEYGAIIKKYGLDFIFLVTPETSEERIKKLDSLSSGFLYAVSSSSTTGSDKNMTDVNVYLQKLKGMKLNNPVLVGFGIKDKASFDAACAGADGAIIGSAYIKALAEKGNVADITKKFLDDIRK